MTAFTGPAQSAEEEAEAEEEGAPKLAVVRVEQFSQQELVMLANWHGAGLDQHYYSQIILPRLDARLFNESAAGSKQTYRNWEDLLPKAEPQPRVEVELELELELKGSRQGKKSNSSCEERERDDGMQIPDEGLRQQEWGEDYQLMSCHQVIDDKVVVDSVRYEPPSVGGSEGSDRSGVEERCGVRGVEEEEEEEEEGKCVGMPMDLEEGGDGGVFLERIIQMLSYSHSSDFDKPKLESRGGKRKQLCSDKEEDQQQQQQQGKEEEEVEEVEDSCPPPRLECSLGGSGSSTRAVAMVPEEDEMKVEEKLGPGSLIQAFPMVSQESEMKVEERAAAEEHGSSCNKAPKKLKLKEEMEQRLAAIDGKWLTDKRKVVVADNFPEGWTVCVFLRTKGGRATLEYRSWKSPEGKVFGTFKEAADFVQAATGVVVKNRSCIRTEQMREKKAGPGPGAGSGQEEGMYQCEICGWRCASQVGVRDHKGVHSMSYAEMVVAYKKQRDAEEKGHCCSLCPGTFASKKNLRRHLKRTHHLDVAGAAQPATPAAHETTRPVPASAEAAVPCSLLSLSQACHALPEAAPPAPACQQADHFPFAALRPALMYRRDGGGVGKELWQMKLFEDVLVNESGGQQQVQAQAQAQVDDFNWAAAPAYQPAHRRGLSLPMPLPTVPKRSTTSDHLPFRWPSPSLATGLQLSLFPHSSHSPAGNA